MAQSTTSVWLLCLVWTYEIYSKWSVQHAGATL